MKKHLSSIFLLCGLGFVLAALPVSAQNTDKIKINREPLKEFREFLKEKVEKKELDLDKPFQVEFEGALTKDGKLDSTDGKFIRVKGAEHEKMNEVAQKGLAALDDSGYFIYLSKLGVEKFNLIIAQDEKTFSSLIKSETETEVKAKTVANGLNMMFQFAKTQRTSEDEKLLLSNTQVTNRGKEFIINFHLPKETAQEWIKQKLRETKSAADLSNSK